MPERTLKHLNDRDLREYRRAVAEKHALESGAVRTTLRQAAGVYERLDALFGRFLATYELDVDEDETVYVSPKTGRIYTRY